MSIDEQIEAAWGEYRSKQHFRTLKEECAAEKAFDEGYLAALRKLFVEVKPEDCAEYGVYWIEVDDDYWEATFRKDKTGDYFDIKDIVSNSEVEIECVGKVYQMVLPSPSDIFGRGE